MPQGAVLRRRKINLALDKGEAVVSNAILPVLQSRFKALSRDLRKANLRKRLAKNDGELYKAGDPTGKNIWQKWFDYFTKVLTKALEDGAGFVWQVEQNYLTSQKLSPFPYNGRDVMNRYLSDARDGTRITNIAADTEVKVSNIIAKWYRTEQSLPQLIDLLEPLFGEQRARLIATTEMNYVASAVARDQMNHYGLTQWIWDAFNDAVVCDLCLELNAQSKVTPFTIDDPMPPDPSHPGCRCGVYYVGVDVQLDKFLFKGGRTYSVTLAKGGPGSGRYPAGSGAHPSRSGGGGTLTPQEQALIDDWTNDATKWRELDEQGKADSLIEAVAKQPRYDGLAYRGMVVEQDVADNIASSQTFKVDGISSFIEQKSVALQYADPLETGEPGVGVVIRTRLSDARVIQTDTISEVAIRKTDFKVVSVVKESNGNLLVVCDQLPGADPWTK